MRHILFNSSVHEYSVAILTKDAALNSSEMQTHYVNQLNKEGIDDVIAYGLHHKGAKVPAAMVKDCLAELMPELRAVGVKHIYVCDGTYFKKLTGKQKTAEHYGYSLPCVIKGYEDMTVTIGGNHKAIYANDSMVDTIKLTLKALSCTATGKEITIGKDVIRTAEYLTDVEVVKQALAKLHQYPTLTCDIEAFSLSFPEAGIATFGFAWDKHNGIACLCDYVAYIKPIIWKDESLHYGRQRNNPAMKKVLLEFILAYKGKLIYHNGNYDIKVLIYNLFMDDLKDTEGMLRGVQAMGINIHDTKIITYLATNNTGGNTLGLKPNTHEFTGKYAEEEVSDIRRIPQPALLKYNLIDCLGTWYLYEKYYDKLVADCQSQVYNEIMLPSVKVLLQIELTGMPLNMPEVLKAQAEMEGYRQQFIRQLEKSPIIHKFTSLLRQKESDVCHSKWKKKVMPLEHFDYVKFNPASNPQLQHLLYEFLEYPVLDRTKSKMPAVGRKSINKLKNLHAKGDEEIQMLESLMQLSEVAKILDTFIAAFLNKSVQKSDGVYYLHGSFNIGGTVSGRLSSSKPNLQNIPSTGSKYAKTIKKCFQAPNGWILVGADFASLEDRISALTTKDPMKLKVYTDGFDGHCLRAYSYFGQYMPDIDPESVTSINSIAELHPDLRQDSKAPTFLLTYRGTYHGMMANLGWDKEKSQSVEEKFHEMYYVSDQWVDAQLEEATKLGYVTVAFGMRVRTPILAKSILNTASTPYEASKEARTAGNALGQSYGMLNNRAGIEFQERCLNSKHRLDILPIAHIHDAQYFMVRNNTETIKWLNDNLVECMQWQELSEIAHDEVKLGGDLELFYPSWAEKISVPNGISEQGLQTLVKEELWKRTQH